IMVLDVTPGTPHRLIHYSSEDGEPKSNVNVTEAEIRRGMHVEYPIDSAGRQWSMLIRPASIWLQHSRSLYPELLCLGGLILTTLLGAYLHLVRTRSQAVSR